MSTGIIREDLYSFYVLFGVAYVSSVMNWKMRLFTSASLGIATALVIRLGFEIKTRRF